MAAIDEIDLGEAQHLIDTTKMGSGTSIENVVRESFRAGLWTWIWNHREDRVSVKIWLIRGKMRIWDLRHVFQVLLGPCPENICA